MLNLRLSERHTTCEKPKTTTKKTKKNRIKDGKNKQKDLILKWDECKHMQYMHIGLNI